MQSELSPQFKCNFCGKSYRRETTLFAHSCEKKRRKEQENERGVQLGYRTYLRFYKIKQNKQTPPTYQEFMESQFYIAFVKFGRHIKMISAKKPEKYIDFVINSGKKLDKWCSDALYEDYLIDMLRKENPSDTLHRAFETMIRWADTHEGEWYHYFKYAAPSVICNDILRGDISPWVLYNCDSGQECLGSFNADHVGMVFRYIDPDYWMKRFENYISDVEYMKTMLKEARL